MGSDTDLMVKAKVTCKSAASPGLSFCPATEAVDWESIRRRSMVQIVQSGAERSRCLASARSPPNKAEWTAETGWSLPSSTFSGLQVFLSPLQLR